MTTMTMMLKMIYDFSGDVDATLESEESNSFDDDEIILITKTKKVKKQTFSQKFSLDEQLTMDKIYHGFSIGYSDGSNIIIKKDENCIIPTAKCFWKDPHDVINIVKTRSQTEKQEIIGSGSMMNYLNIKKETENFII